MGPADLLTLPDGPRGVVSHEPVASQLLAGVEHQRAGPHPVCSSAARVRPRPARTAPAYSTTQVAAGIAMIPAMVIAHR